MASPFLLDQQWHHSPDTHTYTRLPGWSIVSPLSPRYDGTVRNAQGEVVHFLYGEDGLSAEWVEDQTFRTYKLTDEKLKHVYGFEKQRNKLKRYLTDEVVDDILGTPAVRQKLDAELQQLQDDREVLRECMAAREHGKITENKLPLPVHMQRLIERATTEYVGRERTKSSREGRKRGEK